MSRPLQCAVAAVLFIAAQLACSLGGYALSPVDEGYGGGAQPSESGRRWQVGWRGFSLRGVGRTA